MRMIMIELRKEKRTGVVPALLAVGILGALYAFLNFAVRKEALLGLPLSPMDVLLTQLYGMLMILNLFGILAAVCMIYHMEFGGNAIKKMYMLPVKVSGIYLCKFLILSVAFFAAIVLEHLALLQIGMSVLPKGAFEGRTLAVFAAYAFLTSMPVLSFLLLVASRSPNMWVPLGVGVAGFLSGMALTVSEASVFMAHPFILMLKPAAAMTAQPDLKAAAASLAETGIFLAAGVWMAEKIHYE